MIEARRSAVFVIALSLLSTIFSVVVLHSVVFIFHGIIMPFITIGAFIISLAVSYYLAKKYKVSRAYIIPIILSVIVFASIFLGSITLDTTYDGNNYHKYAIGSLEEGWNPLYSEIKNVYSNTYPKASWIFAASIYQLTGNIESGKAINFIVLAMTFLAVFWYARARLSREKSMVVALLLSLSPVATMQLFNNYVDGIMGSFLIVLTIFFNALVDKKIKTPRIYLYSGIIAAIVIVSNLKFTGVVYAGIIVVVYALYLLLMRNWRILKQLIFVGIISLVFAVGVVGASTYIRNYIVHGNPLYPIMGKGSIDVITTNIPVTYSHKSTVHKFLESNLGETDNISAVWSATPGKLDSSLKVPFTFNIAELNLLSKGSPDLRQAGYGVWFGGILLLSCAASAYLLLKNRNTLKNRNLGFVILPIVPVLISIFATDDAWWARYLPQLIIFPVAILGLLYLNKSKVWAGLLSFTLLFNVMLILVLAISYQQENVGSINARLHSLITCTNNKHPQEIVVTNTNGDFTGSTYNMLDICHNLTVKHESSINNTDNGYVEIWNGIYTKRRT